MGDTGSGQRAHEGATFEAPPLTLVPPYPGLADGGRSIHAIQGRISLAYTVVAMAGDRSCTSHGTWIEFFWEVLHPDHGRLPGQCRALVTDSPSPVVVWDPAFWM